MKDQPKPADPPFRPVPTLPIVVEMRREGECRVRVAGRAFAGATLREAIDAAFAAKEQTGAKDKGA